MNNNDSIKDTVKGFIMDEFLPGEDPDSLTNETPLITGGVLDSIARIKLTDFLEQTYEIKLAAYEMGVDHLDNLALIADTVEAKLKARQ